MIKIRNQDRNPNQNPKPKRRVKKDLSLTKQIIALLAGAAVGLCIAISYKRPDIVREISTTLISSFKEPQATIESKSTAPTIRETAKPDDGEDELRFTDSQIKQAMRNVAHERQIQEYRSPKTNKSMTRQGYQLEIELFSGGRIYTDNAEIKKTVVSYTNKRGLIVSIDRKQIKTMKWINAF